MGARFRDPRLLLLCGAAFAFLIALTGPTAKGGREGVDLLAVVDITGSMNVRDYRRNGEPTSRLEFAKAALQHLIRQLPCSSRLGLAIFTERQPFLLFEPLDVCADFAPVSGAIGALDWRMAWEGDSRISAGLFRAIAMARDLNVDLAFITDGQEAPPLPWSGGAEFEGRRGEVRGLIVGAGDYALSPIPKFDDRGREIGFWGVDDVPHESRFGLPPPGAETREGFNARNAPFGAAAAAGNEHLSSVREPYLKQLSNATGLTYHHLDGFGDLTAAVRGVATPCPSPALLDLRPWFAAAAVACLASVYLVIPLYERLLFHSERRAWIRSTKRRTL